MPSAMIDEAVVRTVAMIFMGHTRPDIAAEAPRLGKTILGGSIDKITRILRDFMGEEFDPLRETFKMAKKHGITPRDVFAGHKVVTTLELYEIDVDELSSWLTDLYVITKKKKHDMDSTAFGGLLALVYEILKDGKVSPKDLPGLISQMKAEEIALSRKLQEERKAFEELQERRKKGEEELSKIRTEYIAKKQEIDKMNAEYAELENRVNRLREETVQESGRLSELRERILEEQIAYDEYSKARKLGFGGHHFQMLRNKIVGIARANSMDEKGAVQKFMDDISDQYDSKLGFEQEVERKKAEYNNWKIEISKMATIRNTLSEHIQGLQDQIDSLNERIAFLKQEILPYQTDLKAIIAELPKHAREIRGALMDIRDEIAIERQKTVNAALPTEGLAAFARALKGEHVSVKTILTDLDKAMIFLLQRIPRNVLAHEHIQEVRKAIWMAATHFPPGHDITT